MTLQLAPSIRSTQPHGAYPLYLSGPFLEVCRALTAALGLCWCLEWGHHSWVLVCWT
jgi:hypothetical protein